jgi:hypothetical protein
MFSVWELLQFVVTGHAGYLQIVGDLLEL